VKEIFKTIPNGLTLLAAVVPLLLLFNLAYHNEGHNDWSWMQDAGSWFFLIIAWNFFFWIILGISFAIKISLKKTPRQRRGANQTSSK